MNIAFNGLPDRLRPGMALYMSRYADKYDGQLNINIAFNDEKRLIIERKDCDVSITVSEDVQIFRALTMLIMNRQISDYSFDNQVYFDFNGIMFDFAQASAFLNVNSVKELILNFAALGINTFMIYTEDCIKVDGEPYFGYMRPKYTEEELKEIDDYAYCLGIEVVPCVQTLSHLPNLIRWDMYYKLSEDERTLMPGREGTYELLEKMIKSIMRPLRTNKIHIGLDEAWKLGQGNYLLENGYAQPIEIFHNHLLKVKQIVDKLGLYPMLWNDMYIRPNAMAAFKKKGINAKIWDCYYIPTDLELEMDQRYLPPGGMGYVYWLYTADYEYAKATFKLHQEIFGDVIYAGHCGIATSLTFNRKDSISSSNDSLAACKTAGVRKVMCTVWGDNSREAPPFIVLEGLLPFSEHCYIDNPTQQHYDEMFQFIFGMDVEDFRFLPDLDIYKEDIKQPARPLLYNDVLCGMLDKNYEGIDLKSHFEKFADRARLAKDKTFAAKGDCMYTDMFSYYAAAADFLAIKSTLGIEITNAYKSGDRDKLKNFSDAIIPKVIQSCERMIEAYKTMFFKHYKALGFEVYDIRMGGTIARLKTAQMRIKQHLENGVKLEELEEERLLFNSFEAVNFAEYIRVVSASDL